MTTNEPPDVTYRFVVTATIDGHSAPLSIEGPSINEIRRAVRLLDATEAREIARHYDEEAEFRDQVNRYIHDFEAMLRSVLSARDGHALAVTLLSSDMGKLYVAMAQSIERLRV